MDAAVNIISAVAIVVAILAGVFWLTNQER